MRNHEERDVGLGKVALQPFDHIEVEVVGWLVEDEEFRFFDEQFGQCQAFFLTTGEGSDGLLQVSNIQFKQDFLHLRFKVPCLQVVHTAEGSLQFGCIFRVKHGPLVALDGMDDFAVTVKNGFECIVAVVEIGIL